jgi:hypothetical protein
MGVTCSLKEAPLNRIQRRENIGVCLIRYVNVHKVFSPVARENFEPGAVNALFSLPAASKARLSKSCHPREFCYNQAMNARKRCIRCSKPVAPSNRAGRCRKCVASARKHGSYGRR